MYVIQERHLGGAREVYEPLRFHDSNFFPVNSTFEPTLLLQEQCAT